ncbi:hypothetical protein D918_06517 [Trichuris suis]|nr:hypothetical protein D918_06517 [Trichuris suis]
MAVDSFDEGVNAKIWYELKGKDASCFHIDPDFGLVTTVCDFASSAKRRYEFYVVATDHEGSGLSSTANVSISVVPVEVYLQQWKATANRLLSFPLTMLEVPRSCRTMLVADHVTVGVPRNAALGTAIFLLSSLIAEQGRRFYFRFASKMTAKEMPVALDEQHDLLIVSKPLAKALHGDGDYVVRIVANQNPLRLFCPVEVTVHVIGTRDSHEPFRFTNRLFNFSIDENMPEGLPFIVRNGGGIYVSNRIDREMNDTFNFTVLIGRVHAFDPDSGLNGVVTYDLIDGQDLFCIDQSGMVKFDNIAIHPYCFSL